jgi:predicted peptidase
MYVHGYRPVQNNINTLFTPKQVHTSNEQYDDAYPPTVVLHGGGPPDTYKYLKQNK